MTIFKEFLKKNMKQEMISVELLGKWALNEIEESIIWYNKELKKIKKMNPSEGKECAEQETQDCLYDFLAFEEGTEEAFLKEIAVACLGKEEIRKRLKKL